MHIGSLSQTFPMAVAPLSAAAAPGLVLLCSPSGVGAPRVSLCKGRPIRTNLVDGVCRPHWDERPPSSPTGAGGWVTMAQRCVRIKLLVQIRAFSQFIRPLHWIILSVQILASSNSFLFCSLTLSGYKCISIKLIVNVPPGRTLYARRPTIVGRRQDPIRTYPYHNRHTE